MDPVHMKVVHMDRVQSGGPWTPGPCFVLTLIILAPVVRKVDSAIHWINYYPKDSAIGFRNTYPLDSDLSGG